MNKKPYFYTFVSLVILGLAIIAFNFFVANDSVKKEHDIQTTKNKASYGFNLNGISDWSTQLPFIDLMKQTRKWDSKGANFELDEQGWIKYLEPSSKAETVFLVAKERYSDYLKKAYVFYEGEGVIDYFGAKKIDAESKKGMDVITLGDGNHFLRIHSTNKKNYLRNIQIIPHRFKVNYDKGEIFNPDWLEKIKNVKTLRVMDWMSTNNSTQTNWAKRPKINDRTWSIKGVPLEIIIELCNQLKIPPWFTIPHLADDDYVNNFALTIKNSLDDELIFYIEHSNEVWNWQFKQAKFAHSEGEKVLSSFFSKIPRIRQQWHAIKTANICDVFKNEHFVNDKQKVKCVLALQTAGVYNYVNDLECPNWKARKTECINYEIDYIAITTYFHGDLNGSNSKDADNEYLLKWANEGEKGIDKAFNNLFYGLPTTNTNMQKEDSVLGKLQKSVKTWKNIAEQYDVGLIAYEGGQHISGATYPIKDNKKITSFYRKINLDPRMGDLYTKLMEVWGDNGGGLHMFFVDIAIPSKHGNWGALEHVSLDSSPKWSAILNNMEVHDGKN
jgi:hypothetical protein